MSHQLVRHRISAISQESQRYCDYGKVPALRIVVPPSMAMVTPGTYERDGHEVWRYTKPDGLESSLLADMLRGTDEQFTALAYLNICADAYGTYLWLRGNGGMKPEDARLVLPGATKTEVVTTFNLRMWRHVFKERALNPKAQWQIKKIMREALKVMAMELPIIFGDLQRQLETIEACE